MTVYVRTVAGFLACVLCVMKMDYKYFSHLCRVSMGEIVDRTPVNQTPPSIGRI